MAKKLWGIYDGEPFMENPRLGLLSLLNPKQRKRGKKMAVRRRKRAMPAGLKRYWAKHRRKSTRKAAPARRRRRARRNPWPMAGAVTAANPRRRKRSHRRRNSVMHHRRRHARRNPALLGLTIPSIKSVAFAGVGFISPSIVTALLNSFAPSLLTQATSFGTAGKYIIKVGSVLLLAYGVKKTFGTNEANSVLIGGAVNVGLTLVNDFAPGMIPGTTGLSAYTPTRPGLRAYTPTRPGLRAVAPMTTSRQVFYGGPAGRLPQGSAAPQADQGQYGTASRFFRF